VPSRSISTFRSPSSSFATPVTFPFDVITAHASPSKSSTRTSVRLSFPFSPEIEPPKTRCRVEASTVHLWPTFTRAAG
jgi:hypothetical protein